MEQQITNPELLPEAAFLLEDIFFEDLLAQAVDVPDDASTQSALESYVKEVIISGDVERTMSLGMIVGATACLHSHLEGIASLFDKSGHEHASGHDHHHDHSDEDEELSDDRDDKSRVKSASKMRVPAFGLARTPGSVVISPLLPTIRRLLKLPY